jgi:hypothetical protein
MYADHDVDDFCRKGEKGRRDMESTPRPTETGVPTHQQSHANTAAMANLNALQTTTDTPPHNAACRHTQTKTSYTTQEM